MPNRIIRESCRTSATLYRLTHGAERMFWRLTTVADDFGRFEADAQILKSQCFPLWPDARLKLAQVRGWLEELVAAALVKLYCEAGKTYGFFVTWEKYQATRAKRSKYPEPTSANICEQTQANVSENREARIEKRESRSEESGDVTIAPAPPRIEFSIPPSIITALGKCPALGGAKKLHDPAWWQAEIRANPGVDFAAEVYNAEAWLRNHPEKHYQKLEVFLHGWLKRSDRAVD